MSILLENVSKTYQTPKGPKEVLKDVNLDIPSGVSVGLVGRNGAGKSTLLRILAGAESADQGKVVVPARTSWAIGIASGIATALTGRQNARFIARLHGANAEEIARIEAYTKEFSELGNYFDAPTGTYSAGMRSRLAFALSMAISFDLVLLDEITAVGDASFRERCRQELANRSHESQFVIASHNRSELESMADWGVFVCDAKLYAYTSVGEAFEAYRNWMQKGVHPKDSDHLS